MHIFYIMHVYMCVNKPQTVDTSDFWVNFTLFLLPATLSLMSCKTLIPTNSAASFTARLSDWVKYEGTVITASEIGVSEKQAERGVLKQRIIGKKKASTIGVSKNNKASLINGNVTKWATGNSNTSEIKGNIFALLLMIIIFILIFILLSFLNTYLK